MKIISWNCNMAFRKKAEYILIERPDILVISECENPQKLKFKKEATNPTDVFWYGDNPNKGLAVFSYSDFKIIPLPHNEDFRYVIPLLLRNPQTEFILFAVWCQKPRQHDNYGIHMWNAINYYADLLQKDRIIITGDFNSSSIWDKPNREANHSNIVNLLLQKQITSTYHYFHNQEQGKEKDATLHLHRKIHRSYHIDYCFASNKFIKKLKEVRIGDYDEWIKYSDHKPIIAIFES